MTRKFSIKGTKFSDLLIIQRDNFVDDRGSLDKIYSSDVFDFLKMKIDDVYISLSKKNVVRGLHHQIDHFGQKKLVLCLSGEFLDLALDLRIGSNTYGQLFTHKLSANDNTSLLIPSGFSHGIVSMEDDTKCLTFCSGAYLPQYEEGFNLRGWSDTLENLGIQVAELEFSGKDNALPIFNLV